MFLKAEHNKNIVSFFLENKTTRVQFRCVMAWETQLNRTSIVLFLSITLNTTKVCFLLCSGLRTIIEFPHFRYVFFVFENIITKVSIVVLNLEHKQKRTFIMGFSKRKNKQNGTRFLLCFSTHNTMENVLSLCIKKQEKIP